MNEEIKIYSDYKEAKKLRFGKDLEELDLFNTLIIADEFGHIPLLLNELLEKVNTADKQRAFISNLLIYKKKIEKLQKAEWPEKSRLNDECKSFMHNMIIDAGL